MDYTLLPVWIWLAGILVALVFAGKELAIYAHHNKFTGSDIGFGVATGIGCSLLWPVVMPIYYCFIKESAKVARKTETAKAALDKTDSPSKSVAQYQDDYRGARAATYVDGRPIRRPKARDEYMGRGY